MKHYFISSLILCFSISACSSGQDSNAIVVYDESGVTIELLSLADSRCPSDVTCVWAGDADVMLNIRSGNEEKMIHLHTNPNTETQVSMIEEFGHKITLLDVLPYPVSTQDELSLEEYEVKLNVSPL